MTGEELFLNELNFHIKSGLSKKDLTDLIKQLTIPVVVYSGFYCQDSVNSNGQCHCEKQCNICVE